MSSYLAPSWCVRLTHLRCAGLQIRLYFTFFSPTVSCTTPLQLARLSFPSWCVEGPIGSEKRLISFAQFWGLAGDAYNGIPLYSVWILCNIAMSRLLLNLRSYNMGTVVDEEVGSIRFVNTQSTCPEQSSSHTAVNSHLNAKVVGPSDDIEKGDGDKRPSHRRLTSRDEWSWLPTFPYLHRDQNRDGAGSVFTTPYASSALIPPSLHTVRSGERRRPPPGRKHKPKRAKSGRSRAATGGDTTDPYMSYDEGFTTGSGGVTSGGEWSEAPRAGQERRLTSTRSAPNIKRDIKKPTPLTFDLPTKSQKREREARPRTAE